MLTTIERLVLQKNIKADNYLNSCKMLMMNLFVEKGS